LPPDEFEAQFHAMQAQEVMLQWSKVVSV
jgi:hypothetical protein